MEILIIDCPGIVNLFDDVTQGLYLLVDGDYTPLHDEHGKPYRAPSIAQAEKLSYRLLQPYLRQMTREGA